MTKRSPGKFKRRKQDALNTMINYESCEWSDALNTYKDFLIVYGYLIRAHEAVAKKAHKKAYDEAMDEDDDLENAYQFGESAYYETYDTHNPALGIIKDMMEDSFSKYLELRFGKENIL